MLRSLCKQHHSQIQVDVSNCSEQLQLKTRHMPDIDVPMGSVTGLGRMVACMHVDEGGLVCIFIDREVAMLDACKQS